MSMQAISSFVIRLERIGVKIELIGNYPWVYLHKVNGKRVEEKFLSDHGFTLGFTPIRPGEEFRFLSISETFKIIRKYK